MMQRVALIVSMVCAGVAVGCGGNGNSGIECIENGNCSRDSTGRCVTAPSGRKWCAYGDAACPGSGLRYDAEDVGDGLAGMCVAEDLPDGGLPDAPSADEDGGVDANTNPTLTVSRSGTGGGSITSAPAGIDCGNTCSAQFTPGTMVTLTANAEGASSFAGWSGDCSGLGPCMISMNGDKQVEAVFTAPAGEQLWLRQFGSTGADSVDWAQADSSGNILIAGTFSGTVAFGAGGTMEETSAGAADVFVAKLSGADGSTMWVQTFGGTGAEWIELDGAVDGSGDVVVTGRFSSATASVDGMSVNSVGGDVFVFKLSGTNGAPLWVKSFGGTGFDRGLAVATDTTGDVFITGGFSSAQMTIGTTLVNQGTSGADIFLAKLAASTGNPIWAKSFGASSEDLGRAIATDGFGNVIVGGTFRGTVDFGGLLSLTASGGNDDIFLAKYDTNGGHLWSQRFGGTALDSIDGIAVDGSDRITITGRIDSTGVTFGGSTFNPANTALYIARFSVAGNHLWSNAFATTSFGSGTALSIQPSGSVWLAGKFTGTVNLGGGSMSSAGGSSDIVLASFAEADATHQLSRQYGGAAQDFGSSVAALSDRVIICGSFQGIADFPNTSLTSGGSDDGFCMAVAP